MPTANMVDFIAFFKHYQRSNRKVRENTLLRINTPTFSWEVEKAERRNITDEGPEEHNLIAGLI